MIVELVRFAEHENATQGVLLIDGRPMWLTLEPPWKLNQRNISCIPVGIYECNEVESQRFGRTFLVNNVQGRAEIIFHWGNTVAHTHGCILLGTAFGAVGGAFAILNSRKAYAEFLNRTARIRSFQIEIYNARERDRHYWQ